MGFRAYSSNRWTKNGEKCNMGFGRKTKIYSMADVTINHSTRTSHPALRPSTLEERSPSTVVAYCPWPWWPTNSAANVLIKLATVRTSGGTS